MNSKEGKKRIEDIINTECTKKRNDGKNLCIIIDGNWGVGKTYCVRDIIDNPQAFNLSKTIYFSLFGNKLTIDMLERKLKAQILFKQVSDKKVRVGLRSLGDIVKSVAKEYGIDFDTYLNNIAIEDMPNDKNIVVIIDDIERKSEELLFSEILGLAEKMTTQFSVILIFNKDKCSKEDREAYQLFREKVVDYELEINEITREYLYDILGDNFDEIKKYLYVQPVLFDPKIKNLRIAEKFCELLIEVQQELRKLYEDDTYQITEMFRKEVFNVINDRYIDSAHKQGKHNLIYDFVEKVFEKDMKQVAWAGESIKENWPKAGIVETDCLLIKNGFKVSEEEYSSLVQSLINKVESEDETYFTKQVEVLMACEILSQIGLEDKYDANLFNLAKKIYKFNNIYFDENEFYGALSPWVLGQTDCASATQALCHKINEYNKSTATNEVKKAMNELLEKGLPREYFDYIDEYDSVIQKDIEYTKRHVKTLYLKELEHHSESYLSGLHLTMYAVEDYFTDFLNERKKSAGPRELTLIKHLKKELEKENTFPDYIGQE